MTKVFIDGNAGTTGLRIHERLAVRKDIELILLPDETRKDPSARHEAMLQADITFLCLPDDAARASVMLSEGSKTRIIDTSTAHRTASGWTYGFPELYGKREEIAGAKYVANPGCHASGFISLVEPLVREKLIASDTALTCFSITGYTGGGKKMIAGYEDPQRDPALDAPRQYGLTQMHKHLKEMSYISGLATDPIFCPVVADYPCGMEVTVGLFARDLKGKMADIADLYRSVYSGPVVCYQEECSENGFLTANAYSGSDSMQITVAGNEERILLVSRFDNLGKGASGAAVQNMNIMLGIAETEGLIL